MFSDNDNLRDSVCDVSDSYSKVIMERILDAARHIARKYIGMQADEYTRQMFNKDMCDLYEKAEECGMHRDDTYVCIYDCFKK